MAYLELSEGPLAGKRFPISGVVTIGRNTTNILHLDDAAVSRQHAQIRQGDKCYTLTDLGSVNGSYVNGELLHRLVPRPLYDNDEIILGNSRILFRSEGEEPPCGEIGNDRQDKTVPIARRAGTTSLSVVMTHDESTPPINATIDASRELSISAETDEKSPQRLLSTIKRLQAMAGIAVDLGTVLRPEALAERIMSGIFDIFPHADRAFIMSRDRRTGELVPLAARRRASLKGRKNPEEFPVSRTVLQMVTDKRQSILLSDVRNDSRLCEQRSVVDLSISSLMCAPFICKDELLGVIGVDTMSRQHAFSTDDLLMLTGIASQAAVAIKTTELYATLENETRIRTQLSRYLSRDVVEGVIDGTIPLRLGGEKKWGTILFCDIVGFTGLAENLPALDVVEKLNRYFSLITEIVTRNHGTLHKFGGDMVMAFWNVMVPDDCACRNAVSCGLEMQNAVFNFDIQLEYEGQRPIHLGIGCNTGGFAGGNIGGADRMEYTVIGDNVNLAQRIESLASRWQVLISEETYKNVKELCSAVRLPPVPVKGHSKPIVVYSVRSIERQDGSTLLTIPLFIMTPGGAISGSGLATSLVANGGGNGELHIFSIATIPPWTRLLVQFDLPELAVAPRISGTIKSADRITDQGNCACTHLVLVDLQGDPAALSLMQSGFCMESRKNWQEMRRH